MRVVKLLAAVAALWAMPAHAVVIDLTSADETGVHQKVTLTGLTGADTIGSVNGDLGTLTYFYWFWTGSSWLHDGQDLSGVFNCTTIAGHCDFSTLQQSDVYAASASASLAINVVGNDIFVDWSRIANDICSQIPEADRVKGVPHKCGYQWRPFPVRLDVQIAGPNAGSVGYSVSNYNPVPEPATWALMILGTGLAGAAMRCRQRQVVSYGFA